MFNKDSAIDNPFSRSYTPGYEGPSDAWWMQETIDFPSIANRLERGDSVVVNGRRWYVSGYNSEDDYILVDDCDSPKRSIILANDTSPVTVREERCNIARHGRRLGYMGEEKVW